MGKEIERKFTVKALPEGYEKYPCRIIEQGYLNTNPVVRVRRDSEEYYLTYKGKGFLEREEYNLPLTQEAYEHLLPKADGNIIRKRRYELPLAEMRRIDEDTQKDKKAAEAKNMIAAGNERELIIELDVFDEPFAPLILAEVEFPDRETAEAFTPLSWFEKDVTEDRHFANSYFSRASIPYDPAKQE